MFEYFRGVAEGVIISEGFLGIFVISALESFIFPVPTSAIVTLIGYLRNMGCMQ